MKHCYITSAILWDGIKVTKVGISADAVKRAKRFAKAYNLNADFTVVRTYELPTRRGASGMEQTLHLMLRDRVHIGEELFFIDPETVCAMADEYMALVRL